MDAHPSPTPGRFTLHGFRLRAALIGLALLTVATPGAWAADATYLGRGEGQTTTGTVHGAASAGFAGIMRISIDGGPETQGYCIDIQHGINPGDVVSQTTPDYPCEVLYILNNFFPRAVPLLAEADEAAAVQSAIWFFTDDATTDSPANVAARAAEIVAAAQGQDCVDNVPVVPQTITITPGSATNVLPGDTSHAVTVKVLGSDGQPLTGQSVTVSVSGISGPQSATGTTDAAGEFAVTYTNASASVGDDTITASAFFMVPTGLKFAAEGKQSLVLAGDPVEGRIEATATKSWVPAGCGDGVIDQASEECDDGNVVDGDGCDRNCRETGCGNGIVTAGEQCDDGNSVNGDGCSSTCRTESNVPPPGATENCTDQIDNDGDGLIDCQDPDCPKCSPLHRDPARIVFNDLVPRGDVFSFFAGITPQTPIDPAHERIGVLLTNQHGVLFRGALIPGDMTPQGTTAFRYLHPAGTDGIDSRGGIAFVRVWKHGARYRVRVKTRSDLGAALDPEMTVQLVIGDDAFIGQGTWTATRSGWKLGLPHRPAQH